MHTPDGPALVRRVVAELHGIRVNPGQPLRSTCGERRCVSPEHMVPSSRAAILKLVHQSGAFGNAVTTIRRENAARARGKLTIESVRYIRDSNETDTILAARLGVCVQTINKVRSHVIWKEHNMWRALMK